MAVNSNDFISNERFTNKGGNLPSPTEKCCIQVPKVFDQCLQKICLKPKDNCEQLCKMIPNITDVSQVRCIGCCKNFRVKVNSITKCPVLGYEGYKKITVNYTVTFEIDVEIQDPNNPMQTITETLTYTVNQTVTAPKLYCPDAIAKTVMSKDCTPADEKNQEFIKLEVIGDCLSTDLSAIDCDCDCCCNCDCNCDCNNNDDKKVFLCVTLGLYVMIKCEIEVQLVVACYGYSKLPPQCSNPELDPCKEFMERPVPEFYPPGQKNCRIRICDDENEHPCSGCGSHEEDDEENSNSSPYVD